MKTDREMLAEAMRLLESAQPAYESERCRTDWWRECGALTHEYHEGKPLHIKAKGEPVREAPAPEMFVTRKELGPVFHAIADVMAEGGPSVVCDSWHGWRAKIVRDAAERLMASRDARGEVHESGLVQRAVRLLEVAHLGGIQDSTGWMASVAGWLSDARAEVSE